MTECRAQNEHARLTATPATPSAQEINTLERSCQAVSTHLLHRDFPNSSLGLTGISGTLQYLRFRKTSCSQLDMSIDKAQFSSFSFGQAPLSYLAMRR